MEEKQKNKATVKNQIYFWNKTLAGRFGENPRDDFRKNERKSAKPILKVGEKICEAILEKLRENPLNDLWKI